MAAWKGVPYYAIDMQARTEFAPIDKRDRLAAYFTSPQPVIYVTGGLPEEFATSLKEYPFFVRMFHKNGEILKDNEIDARSETGMTRRDLFMAERILKRQDESGAPVVVAAGKSHMVDTDSPRRPALLEMLTELGKDIIYISHVKDTRGSIKAQEHQDLLFAEAHKGMLETMPEHQRSHYHACFILNSPACWEAGDWSKQGIETFLKSQLI